MSKDLQVVFVDDEVGILEMLKSSLTSLKYEMVLFDNPEEALAYIMSNHKKIVCMVTDFNMPNMTGFELRKDVIEHFSDIPCLLFTGHYTKEMAVEGMALKISHFIPKPIEDVELFAQLIHKESEIRVDQLSEEIEMVKEFLNESSPMLDEIEELILDLEENPGDVSTLNTYFRLLHTIKGTASCLGLFSIAKYAHAYEDLISAIKQQEVSLNSNVINAFLKGLDQLKIMYADAENFLEVDYKIDEIVKIFKGPFDNNGTNTTESLEEEQVKDSTPVKVEKKKDEKVNVAMDLLNNFMEISGELTVLRNTVNRSLVKVSNKFTGDKDIELLTDSISEMHKVSSKLQSNISEMRKVKVDNVYRPMKRVVRDSCKSLGKEVHFHTKGEDLRIDTILARLLNNVLVHLLRNGIDHGIESSDDRVKSGKEEIGTIELNTFQMGENIIVELSDDGGGMDPDKICQKAIEKGLISESELDHLNEQRIFKFIFESGFSTNELVTDVSGRGVGMDMVKSSIEEIGGKIFIDSKLGRGTTFTLQLPIPRSILIINSLMILQNGRRFSLPLDDVGEVVLCAKENGKFESVESIEGGHLLRHHGKLVPLISMEKILYKDTKMAYMDKDSFNVVIVRGEGINYGVIVDEIDSIEEVVVKEFSNMISHVSEFLGVTYIGDQELALILNLEGISKIFNFYNDNAESAAKLKKEVVDSYDDEQEYMCFNLFNEGNYAIPLHWVNRLEFLDANTLDYSLDTPIIRYRDTVLRPIHLEGELGLSHDSLNDIKDKNDVLNVIVVKHRERYFGLLINMFKDISQTTVSPSLDSTCNEFMVGTIYIDDQLTSIIDVMRLISPYIDNEEKELQYLDQAI